jgi:hypothetical protein
MLDSGLILNYKRIDFDDVFKSHFDSLVESDDMFGPRFTSTSIAFCGSPYLGALVDSAREAASWLLELTGHRHHELEFNQENFGHASSRKRDDLKNLGSMSSASVAPLPGDPTHKITMDNEINTNVTAKFPVPSISTMSSASTSAATATATATVTATSSTGALTNHVTASVRGMRNREGTIIDREDYDGVSL